ncbi:MAG: winged helix-turn-helix transcriptional regulator [Lentisphaeria bacterium]|nr:winged helix-turn-helix transcriptional regulator [Lentisphaeria bacterium]
MSKSRLWAIVTDLGKTLVPIVNAMSDWGHNYFEYLGIPDPCPED